MEEYLKDVRNNIFIFSTTEISENDHPKDNLYMWGHYGNGHRGIAIEFDTSLLTGSVLKQQEKLGGITVDVNAPWSNIKYQDELPEITCEHIYHCVMHKKDAELEKILELRLFSKSIEWKIEKEWRLMWHNDETKLKIVRLDLLDDTITAVYLGCRIPDDINDDIIFETKSHFPKAEIFKARKVKGKFALDFERILMPSNRI